LARVDAGPGPGTVPRTGPDGVRAGLPGDARRRLHGRRRVPLPRLAGGARSRRGGRRGGDRNRAALRGVWARRAGALPAGVAGRGTTVVHAPHAAAHELDLLAESGARVCICPTTEANLGDGFAPAEEICERGIGICIGSDSNVRIDPLEELRELEGTARRRTG